MRLEKALAYKGLKNKLFAGDDFESDEDDLVVLNSLETQEDHTLADSPPALTKLSPSKQFSSSLKRKNETE